MSVFLNKVKLFRKYFNLPTGLEAILLGGIFELVAASRENDKLKSILVGSYNIVGWLCVTGLRSIRSDFKIWVVICPYGGWGMLFDMLYKIKMGIIHILIKIEEITTCHF